MGIRFFPDVTNFRFVANRYWAFGFDGLLALITVVSLFVQGLNLGIDFTGGVVVEVSRKQPIDVGELRAKLGKLGFGEVTLQSFDNGTAALIRVQPGEGVTNKEKEAAQKIRDALGPTYVFNKVEAVGPKVSGELFTTGVIATILSIIMIAVYVAFRFEWQFGIAGMVATAHDVLIGAGLYSVLQLDFNLTSVAALLLLAGYSINDTVVVFDRIRENRRKFKRMPLGELIDVSTNATLSRTVMTSMTTALSVVPLVLFGGDTLNGFAACILWGIVIGTYSSIFVASCLLLYLPAITLGQTKEDKSGVPAQV
jgi:preprotein translocase SecF subunit